MIDIIKKCLKERFGIEPKMLSNNNFFLPICGEVNFDSAYDYLANFLSTMGYEAYELSGSENFISEEFTNISIKKENFSYRVVIYSEGGCILFKVT